MNPFNPGEEEKQKIINDIIAGKKLIDVCKRLKIDPSTFFKYCKKDPLFSKNVAQARVDACDLMTDELTTIFDDAYSIESVQAAKGKSDNIKWLAAKRSAEKYGDSLNLNVKHSVDLTKVLEETNQRTMPYQKLKEVNPSYSADEFMKTRDCEIIGENAAKLGIIPDQPETVPSAIKQAKKD